MSNISLSGYFNPVRNPLEIFEPTNGNAIPVDLIFNKLNSANDKKLVTRLRTNWGVDTDGNEFGTCQFDLLSAGVLIQKVFTLSGLGFSVGDGGGLIRKIWGKIQNIDFPLTAAQSTSNQDVNVPGAAVGDMALVSIPETAVAAFANQAWDISARVIAVDTVRVRFRNENTVAALDPAAADYKILVISQ